jgi:hypothetical protein
MERSGLLDDRIQREIEIRRAKAHIAGLASNGAAEATLFQNDRLI